MDIVLTFQISTQDHLQSSCNHKRMLQNHCFKGKAKIIHAHVVTFLQFFSSVQKMIVQVLSFNVGWNKHAIFNKISFCSFQRGVWHIFNFKNSIIRILFYQQCIYIHEEKYCILQKQKYLQRFNFIIFDKIKSVTIFLTLVSMNTKRLR